MEDTVITRIWRASFDPSRLEALKIFAHDRSLPYLRRQPGNLGVLYLTGDDAWLTVTFWSGRSAIDAMEASQDYQALAREIEQTGAILTVLSLESFDVQELEMSDWPTS